MKDIYSQVGTDPSVKKPAVKEQLDIILDQQKSLFALVLDFEAKLTPILTPLSEPPKNASADEKMKPVSMVTSTLIDSSLMNLSIHDKLNQIYHRIEV